MPLVVAIEPDSRQAAVIRRILRERVKAELVLADTKDEAIAILDRRVPDLILVSTLLSPRDESDLTDRLRELDGAEHLQTLTIPQLATGPRQPQPVEKSGLLGKFTRRRPIAMPHGCEPAVFAEEIRGYLDRATNVREDRTAARERKRQEAEAQAQLQANQERQVSSELEESWQEIELQTPLEAEEQARLEADQRARLEADRRAQLEAEARALREAEERARREAEAHARLAAERQALLEAEVQARCDAEEHARFEAQWHAQREIELQAAPAATGSVDERQRKFSKHTEQQPKAGPKPIQDEWGIYDPGQCGFDALFAKLETATEQETHGEIKSVEPVAVPTPAESPRRPDIAPLAMWASLGPSQGSLASDAAPEDDLCALMGQLRLPPGVAAVSYPTGARIGRVHVNERTRRVHCHERDEPLIILSRKRLRELRKNDAFSRTS